MKKVLCIVMCVCLLLLCSCGAAKETEKSSETELFCFFSIECATILNHLEDLNPDKTDVMPEDGIILEKTQFSFEESESVYDLLVRVCKDKGIQMDASWIPAYNCYSIDGIHNLYSFDCGQCSGWMFSVNGVYPSVGCSQYELKAGDVVEFRYTCDYGLDIGCVFE